MAGRTGHDEDAMGSRVDVVSESLPNAIDIGLETLVRCAVRLLLRQRNRLACRRGSKDFG